MSLDRMNPQDFLDLTYAYAREALTRRSFLAAGAVAAAATLGGGALA